LAIERTDADLMHLERRITALEGRSRNILLRLHDKIVGDGTVFGTSSASARRSQIISARSTGRPSVRRR
jgi:hypothetical protein